MLLFTGIRISALLQPSPGFITNYEDCEDQGQREIENNKEIIRESCLEDIRGIHREGSIGAIRKSNREAHRKIICK